MGLQSNTMEHKSVWDNVPSENMSGHCITEYHDLRYLLFGGMASTIGNIAMKYLAATKPCGGIPLGIVSAIEGFLLAFLLVLSFSGFYHTAGEYDLKDIKHCEALHNYAWWLFFLSCCLVVIPAVLFCAFLTSLRRTEGRTIEPGDATDCNPYEKLGDGRSGPEIEARIHALDSLCH